MSTPGSKEIEGRSADTDSGEGVSPTQELQVAENTQPTSGAVTNQEEQQQQPQRTSGWQIVKSMATRLLFIYLISSFFKRSPSNTQPGAATGPLPSANLFMKGAYLDMFVYVSENEVFTEFNKPEFLFWSEFQVVYGDWNSGPYADGSYVKSGEIAITEAMQNNGSIYLHVFFTEAGHSPNPDDTDNYNRLGTFHRSKRLNRYKKKHYAKTMNLLTGQTVATAEEIKKAKEVGSEVLSHWHPNLTINLLDDQTHWVKGSVPPPLDQYIEFEPSTGRYYPAIFLNDYWNLNADYQPINASLQTLTLTLTLAPIASWKWQMYAAQTAKKSWWVSWMDEGAEENDDDQDTVKKAFLDTNPYLLAVTVAVSVLHSIFEFLAFKNDIQFWRTRESLEGLSARTVLFGVFQSVVVLLYVLDNEANTLVRISCFIGVGIDCWKVPKVLTITLDRSGVVPWPRFVYKGSYATSATSDFDKTAFKYLSWLLFPLLAGYAVYSLLYQEHKGWYSWMLGMVYGFLLTFGFIMMTPQLFINYKLKSVAHLPWRMMTYKALNTFIDDMFAFVIQMPTMYRIGCLRDDVIFFVYLYQRWIYRVDPKRFNEFGTTGEMAAGVEPSKAIGDTDTHEETTGKQKSE